MGLDFGSGPSAPVQSNDLLGDMMGSAPSQPPVVNNNPVDFGMGFGNDAFGNDTAGQEDTNDGAGWADAFGDSSATVDREKYHLNFARAELVEVLNPATPGSKQKAAGLGVNAAINYSAERNQLVLELQF